jgi:hypothetical protein
MGLVYDVSLMRELDALLLVLLLDDYLSSLICFLNNYVAGPEVLITSESSSSLFATVVPIASPFFFGFFFPGTDGCTLDVFTSCFLSLDGFLAKCLLGLLVFS